MFEEIAFMFVFRGWKKKLLNFNSVMPIRWGSAKFS